MKTTARRLLLLFVLVMVAVRNPPIACVLLAVWCMLAVRRRGERAASADRSRPVASGRQ